MASPKWWSLNTLVALALLLNLVFYVIAGAPETRIQLSVSLLLGTTFCLLSSFALLGLRTGVIALVVTYILAWVAEEVGVTTGLIFGQYFYTNVLGVKLGSVPIVVPLYWYVFLYTGYVIAALVMKRGERYGGGITKVLWRSLLVAFVVTDYDLAFDPHAAYKVKAWTWVGMDLSKGYFGVPLHNYYGWVCTAFVLALVLQLIRHKIGDNPPGPRTTFTILSPVFFYTIWWVAYTWDGFPAPVRVVSMIAMGIPALAAVASWIGIADKGAEQIAQEAFSRHPEELQEAPGLSADLQSGNLR